MKPISFSIAAALLLAMALPGRADVTIAAQPITLSAAAGMEQSGFFITSSKGSDFVEFFGATPAANGKHEVLRLCSTKMRSPSALYTKVGPSSPLRVVASYTVAPGIEPDTFLQSDFSADASHVREVFRIPGKGLYFSQNGGVPLLLHIDTATAPISGAALRYPANLPNDPDHTRQFRVIFGALRAGKGREPFQSTGAPLSTKILADLESGSGSSNPAEFTTFADEAYFTTFLDTSGVYGIYDVSVDTSHPTPTLTAAAVVPGLLISVNQLMGTTAGLFCTETLPSASHANLFRSSLPIDFQMVNLQVQTGMTNSYIPVLDATQLTPSINPQAGELAFSAYDTNAQTTRIAIYNATAGYAVYPYIPVIANVPLANPQHIVSTGNYFYFAVTLGGSTSNLWRSRTGQPAQYVDVDGDISNAGITNVQEMVDVPTAEFGGRLYVVGDGRVDGTLQTGVLFALDPNSGDDMTSPVAVPVRTLGLQPVHLAHHLQAIADGQVSRLYFSAPVDANTNTEYATGGKDYGDKPWVVNAP